MNEYDFAESIKRKVSMHDAARFYGLTFNRTGFAYCPFHNEKTPSFKIHNSKGHCFGGCGWSGDVIQFVQDMFKLDFNGAIRKLNSDFSLALPIDRKPTLREQRDAEKRHRELMAERVKREAEEAAYNKLYNSLWDEYARIDKNLREYKPKSIDETMHPLYVEAITSIDQVKYQIDTLL